VNANGHVDFTQLEEKKIEISGKVLDEALQYGDTAGSPNLLEWLHGLQEVSHQRKKGEGWRISVTSGSQDAIYKAVTAILNPGDPVLVESPVYAGVIPLFWSLDSDMVEIETDAFGIKASSLRSVLENWPEDKAKPKVLYTVPYGSNPTGMTSTLERRKEILSLAREYNFLIFEDDPYFYLYYGSLPRPPSYFALERQVQLELQQDGLVHPGTEIGRVIRFDSVSKVLSSGIRLGCVSGPTALLNAMDMHTASASLQTPSLTQTIAFALLDSWGYDGFIKHCETVSQFYKEKRDVFEKYMQKHLGGLAEWTPPESGMFYWFKLLSFDGTAGDSEFTIRTKAFEKGVLALPGSAFLPNGAKSAYVRASFSLLSEEQVDEALKRLKTVLEEEKTKALNGTVPVGEHVNGVVI